MKILFVNEYAPPHQVSGAEYSMIALAEALGEKGIEVKILSPDLSARTVPVGNPTGSVLNVKFPFWKKIQPGAILSPLWFNNPIFYLYSAWHIYRTVIQAKINLIHVHGKYILPGAVIAGWLAHKPVIVTIRDYNFLCPLALCFLNQKPVCRWPYYLHYEIPEYQRRYHGGSRLKLILAKLWQAQLKWWLTRANQIIAISPAQQKIYLDNGLKRIIPIFNLPAKPLPSLKSKYKIKGKKILISVGKLSYGKGTDSLLTVMNLVKTKLPDLQLLLAGAKNISLSAGFPENVQYLGKLNQTDIQNLYASADAFIILSRWPEPFGRATLDALAAGLPVIVSNRGAGSEFVNHNGYLVDPDKPQPVAGAIIKLFSQNLTPLGKNSRRLFQSRFNRQKLLQKHLKLYQQFL